MGCATNNDLAGNGGGIYVGKAAYISNCYILANVATNMGGGIYLSPNATNVLVWRCLIANNTAGGGSGGGGLAIYEPAYNITGMGCTIISKRDSDN